MKKAGAIVAVRMVRSRSGLIVAKLSNVLKLMPLASPVSKLLKANSFPEARTNAFAS